MAGAILRLIFSKLGLPCPEQFAQKEMSAIEQLLKGKKVCPYADVC
jgi:hypothetical protein